MILSVLTDEKTLSVNGLCLTITGELGYDDSHNVHYSNHGLSILICIKGPLP
jgi:hypothetical protein